MKIREIKYLRKFKFYIDSNSKASRFAKLSTCKDGSNLQFAKLSPHEIKVFYSMLYNHSSFMNDAFGFLRKIGLESKNVQVTALMKKSTLSELKQWWPNIISNFTFAHL